MEGSSFNARGSMGIPAKLQDGLAQARSHAAKEQSLGSPGTELAGVKMDQLAGAPTAAPVKELTDEEKIKADAEKSLAKFKADLEKALDCTFSEDDLATYILKGEVSKEVTIIAGSLKGVFRTLQVDDGQNVDLEVKKLIDKNTMTGNGVENEKVLLTLSKVWTHINYKKKSEDWAGTKAKAFAGDELKRLEAMRKMGAGTVEAASNAWTNFNALLKLTLGEETTLGK